jgi:hypothetical protein
VKWLALIVALIVAGAVAGFAIYTWGWREEEKPSLADEQARARAAADEIAASCDPTCTVESLTRIGPELWKLEAVENGRRSCVTIHVDVFRPLSGGKFTGYAATRC